MLLVSCRVEIGTSFLALRQPGVQYRPLLGCAQAPPGGHARRVEEHEAGLRPVPPMAARGTWHRIFTALQFRADAMNLITWEIKVDSTVCRAHQHAAEARNRGMTEAAAGQRGGWNTACPRGGGLGCATPDMAGQARDHENSRP
ncbi:hypothetical protein GCM10010377_70370 [Streptomyces viridiviolaceus]|nr:hypothetical protein GCM10010377_70370 [Streptomyces viridiviolaceus]